jgi:hypothetical protein
MKENESALFTLLIEMEFNPSKLNVSLLFEIRAAAHHISRFSELPVYVVSAEIDWPHFTRLHV